MRNNLLLQSITKGIITSIAIFILSKIYMAIEWTFQSFEIFTIVYYLLIIFLISFVIKNKVLKGYWISVSIFSTSSICLELFLSHSIINHIFKLIHGLDAEMWAGDGFLIVTTYISTSLSCIIGLIIALILSFLYKKRNK